MDFPTVAALAKVAQEHKKTQASLESIQQTEGRIRHSTDVLLQAASRLDAAALALESADQKAAAQVSVMGSLLQKRFDQLEALRKHLARLLVGSWIVLIAVVMALCVFLKH